jgi:Asp-tRNA(Asn)/Glu-tRNA(Gln) amidotransferase A subunit family amidase
MTRSPSVQAPDPFNIVEASIADHRKALESGNVTSVELVVSCLIRIGTYDIRGGLNAFTVFNDKVFEEAEASDARRAAGLPPRPLEGIPYTIKDSYKVKGLTVTNGSPALRGLQSSKDSAIAAKLRAAGAILIGKTNMPPMAAGGMQRGMYGRAESPYNPKYLTAAFSSGSSNGAATSTATSMAVFGMGSETVSSGRSPASNNALVAYTPSRGILSCQGLWPLYVTCDDPVPLARSVTDMLEILSVIAEPDEEIEGDFWREQVHVKLPRQKKTDYQSLVQTEALKGKRIGVPKMYVGQQDSHPHVKPPFVSTGVTALWETACADLQALGAEIIYTDFPLVTNYEDDSISGEANNVVGRPADWNKVERGLLIAKAWSDFLKQNNDTQIPNLSAVDPHMLFPKPPGYIPDTFLEVRNWIYYSELPAFEAQCSEIPIYDLPGLGQALKALEAQRKRDLEDWMDELKLDCVAFPAAGDVGYADLEFDVESAKHSHQIGVKYSNGNRAIRHMGVPTVSVPMGIMPQRKMPVNLTFAGRAYEDERLLAYAYAFERQTQRRSLPLPPPLRTDLISSSPPAKVNSEMRMTASVKTETVEPGIISLRVSGTLSGFEGTDAIMEVYVNGEQLEVVRDDKESWSVMTRHEVASVAHCLGWDLKPLPPRDVMILVVGKASSSSTVAKLLWAPVAGVVDG